MPDLLPAPLDDRDRRVLEDIERYGCHVVHVLAEGELPPFAYSVGIERSSGAPEMVVVGLKQGLAHSLVNHYNDRVRGGEAIEAGALHEGFVDGHAVLFEQVHRSQLAAWLARDLWLYGGDSFRALQLVYPTVEGLWPWEDDAPAWFRDWQPLLSRATSPPASGLTG